MHIAIAYIKMVKRMRACMGVEEKRLRIEEALASFVSGLSLPIKSMMEYAVLGGGKRVRGVICLATAEALVEDTRKVLPIACSLELVHAFSLVHDDIMDKADERRGRPPCYKKFGIAEAILIGDALLVEALKSLEGNALRIITEATLEMISGQLLDVGRSGDVEKVQKMKTSSLFRASALAPAENLRADASVKSSLASFGEKFGLAFQILDDLKDMEEDKKVGSPNLAIYLGEEEAEEMMKKLVKEARSELRRPTLRLNPEPLDEVVDWVFTDEK